MYHLFKFQNEYCQSIQSEYLSDGARHLFSRTERRTGVQKLISWNVLCPASCEHPMGYESTISRTPDAEQPRRTLDNGASYSTTINETTQDPGICWDEYLFYQPRVIMYMHLLLYYSLFLLLYYSLLCVSRRSDHGNEGSYQNTAWNEIQINEGNYCFEGFVVL